MTEELIGRKGWKFDTGVALRDLWVTGWKGKNAVTGALSELVKLCKAKRIKAGSVLVMDRIERLTRNQVPPAMRLWHLRRRSEDCHSR